MKLGRNAPCPCGSGKKYKKCCLSSGRFEQSPTISDADVEAAVVAAARRARTWEVGFRPVPIHFEDQPNARPTVAFVVAEGLVLHTDLLTNLSVELDDLRGAFVGQIEAAIRHVGHAPRSVRIDEPALVEHVGPRLPGPLDGVVLESGSVDQVDDAWVAMCAEMLEGEPERVVVTRTWRGWQQPDAWIVAMFEAGARFFRSQPWRQLGGEDAIEVEIADGETFGLIVMGAAGETFGLLVIEDLETFFDEDEFSEIDGGPAGGEVLACTFFPRNEAPPDAQREIRTLGLTLAGPTAYPALQAVRTRAAGLPRTSAERLLRSMDAVASLFEGESDVRHALSDDGWTSSDGAIRMRLLGADDPLEDWPGELEPDRLRPGATTGPEADPQACAALTGMSERGPEPYFDPVPHETAFQQALLAEGLKDNTVDKHVKNAGIWLRYLSDGAGVKLEALHEIDLRTFLYEWYPRKELATLTEARTLLTSLRRFFAHTESVRGLRFAWSAPLLADRDTFMQRWETIEPGPFWSAAIQEWQMPFYDHLRALALSPSYMLGEDDEWGATSGILESELLMELQRHWLLWREALIQEGKTSVAQILLPLHERQLEWELSPHPRYDGATPYDVILEERREMAERRRE